jgi:hypothetical protein
VILKACVIETLQYRGAATLTRPAPGHLLSLDDMAKLAHRPLPPLHLLEDLFFIDPQSPSWLSWKNPRSRRIRPGDHAGWQNNLGGRNAGYFQIGIQVGGKDQLFLGHRIVYYMYYKIDPGIKQVDHIDGNKFNHGPLNLRLTEDSGNRANAPKRNQTTSSRFKGVCRAGRNEKRPWIAYIDWNKKRKYLGTFETEEQAAEAYNQTAMQLHGEYAFLNDLQATSEAELR